jgi:ketoreductase RED1
MKFDDVAVVGAGTIGVSWTALFLAHGARVRLFDVRPDIREYAMSNLEQIAPTLSALGLPTQALTQRLEISGSLESAVTGAQVVQENGPEILELKHKLLADIERATAATTLLLSSTSALPATQLAANLAHPERLLVGHPFNPPHLVPLVEVVPGERTDPGAVASAVEFYAAMGKHPIVVRKEIPGFVANRLQAALFRECVYLVSQGVVEVDGLDEIVTSSIGLRWAAEGPFLSFHLGGGPGGLAQFLQHLGPGLEGLWKVLGTAQLDDQTVNLLSSQAARAFGARPMDEWETERDRRTLGILNVVAATPATPGVA